MKTSDLFFAGAISGLISGLALDTLILILRSFGAPARTPWDDTAALMLLRPEFATGWAKLIAFPVSLITPMIMGIILCLVLKQFGRDFLYFMSIFLAEVGTFLMLIIVYPALGLEVLKHSVATYYAAFCGMFVFGFVLGYTIKRIADFKPEEHEHP